MSAGSAVEVADYVVGIGNETPADLELASDPGGDREWDTYWQWDASKGAYSLYVEELSGNGDITVPRSTYWR